MAKRKMMTRRRKNNSVRPGMQFGHLEVLQRVATPSGSSGGQRWALRCSCGNRITKPQFYLIRQDFPLRHCGCQKREAQPHTRERGIFYMMHRRCYNPTHVAYPHYGGATPPIGVCDSWNKDIVGNDVAWKNFITDMGPAPSRKHTLDRKDPYLGYGWQPNHTTGVIELNCQWATATEQMTNQKKHWLTPAQRAAAKFEAFTDVGDGDEEETEGDVD